MRGIAGQMMVLIARVKPRLSRIRYMWMSHAFEKAGARGSIGRHVQIHGNLRVELGDRVAVRDGCQFGGNGLLRVGDRTVINAECILTAVEQIVIGNDVMIAPRVYILDVNHRFTNRLIPISKQGYDTEPVFIGDGVWIGTGAVVTKGVKIGEGAIIGANAVVTCNIPAYTIAVGMPARVIKERSL